jgi:hypothetical protein
MSVIRLPIDTKSLHCNIKNDNKNGHTATVATPLKQGSSYDRELGRIFEIPKYKNFDTNHNLINDFADSTILILFTDIAKNPKIHQFTIQEANKFTKNIALIVYTREDDNE